jgi:hypothetical protein
MRHCSVRSIFVLISHVPVPESHSFGAGALRPPLRQQEQAVQQLVVRLCRRLEMPRRHMYATVCRCLLSLVNLTHWCRRERCDRSVVGRVALAGPVPTNDRVRRSELQSRSLSLLFLAQVDTILTRMMNFAADGDWASRPEPYRHIWH